MGGIVGAVVREEKLTDFVCAAYTSRIVCPLANQYPIVKNHLVS